MSSEVTLQLNDALYNAGILGFMRIAEKQGIPYRWKGNRLQFQLDDLQNFTESYLNTVMDTYRDDTVYATILKQYDNLICIPSKEEENLEKWWNDKDKKIGFRYIKEKMERVSYKKGFAIIKERGETYDFLTNIKGIKEEKQYEKKAEKLAILIDKLNQYENVFLLKDIAYTKIQPFWTTMAFLNSKESETEFHTSFEKTFVDPAVHFQMDEKNGKFSCCQCDVPLTKSNGCAMAWVNDVGIDIARKTSYFWEFNVDSFLCPVCNLIYACIPLGFTMKGSEGIFVNDNMSLRALKEINAVSAVVLSGEKEDLFFRMMEQFSQITQATTMEQEVENIQVVRRSNGRYVFNILSKEKLQVLNFCKKDFAVLARLSLKLQGVYVNIYRSTMQRILNGENLYSLLYEILHTAIEAGTRTWFVRYLLKIQAVAFAKGERGMQEEKTVFAAMHCGADLRARMLGDDKNENKVRGLSYKLLNALKVKDSHEFMDTVLRNYIGLGAKMPNGFVEVLKDENSFLNFGYAFVTGLNGGLTQKDETVGGVK
ncbi:MAG: cas8a1 [Firmicutes bacterium]|nr:cas8a1 [Bacillota bacterium]